MIDIKAVAVMHKEEILGIIKKLSELKGWNIGSAKGALRCLPAIIKQVEAIGKARDLTGAEKNGLAVEFIMLFLRLPWWLPASFVRPALSGIVDAVVDALKDRFN